MSSRSALKAGSPPKQANERSAGAGAFGQPDEQLLLTPYLWSQLFGVDCRSLPHGRLQRLTIEYEGGTVLLEDRTEGSDLAGYMGTFYRLMWLLELVLKGRIARLNSVQLQGAGPLEVTMVSDDWAEANLNVEQWYLFDNLLARNRPQVRLSAPKIETLLLEWENPPPAACNHAIDSLRTRNMLWQDKSAPPWESGGPGGNLTKKCVVITNQGFL